MSSSPAAVIYLDTPKSQAAPDFGFPVQSQISRSSNSLPRHPNKVHSVAVHFLQYGENPHTL
ncbi:hypothetical protein IEQ34_001582 [Dendrobium chrysotoxum]|uniref:Uncharacterized protein n=1 Tax=Dendrobium chrysotoxum TaxID=161865 RepID=A0AAV7H8C2_DENCH|nr:hypothetical protein IEQ34_001582 [Dendrobium chrysotoxum]